MAPGTKDAAAYIAWDGIDKRGATRTNRITVDVPRLDAITQLLPTDQVTNFTGELEKLVDAAFTLGLKEQRRRDRASRKLKT